jgi:hypothetical protein
MANSGGAFGLRPARHLSGSSQWQVEKMYVSANYATAIFVGDPILVEPLDANADPTGKHRAANVSDAVDADIIIGACVGIEPIQTDLNKQYIPASTGGYIYVCTARDAIYEIRGDGGGTPVKQMVGLNAVMIATAAGSTATGLSGWELDEGTSAAPAADQSYPLLIVGIKDVEDNTLADDAVWLVRLNTALNIVGDVVGVSS